MAGPSPEVVLFDVMDTLVVDPFRDVMPAFFGLTFEEMMRAKDPHAWVDFELSRIDEATFFARFFADRRAFDGDAFRAHVEAAYRYVDGVEPVLARLRARGVPMHALSNYPSWYALVDRRVGLSRYLDGRFVSFETGVRKPDAEAYVGAARALGAPPARCLFVDDRAGNCEAAIDVGMDAFVFTDARALEAELAARGLL